MSKKIAADCTQDVSVPFGIASHLVIIVDCRHYSKVGLTTEFFFFSEATCITCTNTIRASPQGDFQVGSSSISPNKVCCCVQ